MGERNTTKAQKLSILLRKPFPRPLWIPEGEPTKAQKLLILSSLLLFAGAISKDSSKFPGFPASGGSRNAGGTPQKPKTCRFCGEPAPFPEAISKVCLRFLHFRHLGPPKWGEPHKSPKVVDFVKSAPSAAISKACLDFLRVSGFWDGRNGGKEPHTKAQKLSIL